MEQGSVIIVDQYEILTKHLKGLNHQEALILTRLLKSGSNIFVVINNHLIIEEYFFFEGGWRGQLMAGDYSEWEEFKQNNFN